MNHSHWRVLFLAGSFALVLMVSAVNAVVIPLQGGHWPADWPAALEPLRAASRTIQVATGSQETIYEIPINDRETFDRVWVAVRTLATPGGQLTLYHTEPARLAGWGNILSNAGTTIRIYAPSGGCFSKGGLGLATEADIKQAVEQGAALRAEPPWPKSIIGPGGELPQFVTFDTDSAGHAIWISAEEPIDASRLRGFLCRARIDLDLIVDGTTVDLNQIQLPKNVRVIDRRFSGEK